MRKIVLQYAGLGALLAALLPGLPVQAQLWVASSGSGTSCSRSAPCNSLSVAVNLAIPGMEIRCADSTQFGDVIISKSITIDCAGTNSVIMPTFGIVIDAPGIVVTLRGLNIMGLGSNVGIDFVNG